MEVAVIGLGKMGAQIPVLARFSPLPHRGAKRSAGDTKKSEKVWDRATMGAPPGVQMPPQIVKKRLLGDTGHQKATPKHEHAEKKIPKIWEKHEHAESMETCGENSSKRYPNSENSR